MGDHRYTLTLTAEHYDGEIKAGTGDDFLAMRDAAVTFIETSPERTYRIYDGHKLCWRSEPSCATALRHEYERGRKPKFAKQRHTEELQRELPSRNVSAPDASVTPNPAPSPPKVAEGKRVTQPFWYFPQAYEDGRGPIPLLVSLRQIAAISEAPDSCETLITMSHGRTVRVPRPFPEVASEIYNFFEEDDDALGIALEPNR